MTENKTELKSISELLGKNFFVPSYQRGYRWTKQQVEDLLNDIYSFAKKDKSITEFYCLQPIIVRKCNEDEKKSKNLHSELDNNTWYEVVDGQQRLTTIHILLSYLVKELYSGKSLYDRHREHQFQIEYETRKGSQSLNNIAQQTEQQRDDDIDFYFFDNTFKTITSWFSENKELQDHQESIRNTLVYGLAQKKQEGVVQVIWYEIDDTINPIDTFIRINMGKIPLTNAELIKALFLQEKNYGDKETANLRKVSIAKEWDEIEYAFGNEDFWWFINKEQNDVPARIEFLFDLICDIEKQEHPNLEEEIGTDEYVTFRLFYNKFNRFDNDKIFKEVEKQWNEVKDYFLAFEEWYNHPVWYHYIGFLIYAEYNVVDIYKLYKGRTKDSFTQELKTKIKDILNVSVAKTNDPDEYEIDLKYDNKDKVRKTLLLYNVQYIVHQYAAQNKQNDSAVFIKFPFKLFKNEQWDIEHVDSYTTNSIKDKKTADDWLKAAIEDLELEKKKEFYAELLQTIDEFIHGEDFSQFNDLRDKIIKIAGENENDEDLKNSIGNLTLLDSGTNRGYGNALFPTKRRIILEKDSNGTFIPICTKNVFLKSFTKKPVLLSGWTEDDIANYQNNICSILEDFLTINTK
ncbi:MAG: DUF262 domain-containing HNH endonuclease family protein [Bacteroidales bacterium]|jgi:uncharacterized protein with ParB-like and HNH nuclease domain|nr:DUF262 domain-containing HNH endonuclease family protein [Bacteroidales bacterium]